MADKKKIKRVKPRLLKGFRDYSPEEQRARDKMLDELRDAVELMGFLPLQTPSLELAETLLGPHYNKDSLSELFGFEGPDELSMALRYEFTISLARYVASQQNLPTPFRRYQYGNCWRVDKPGPGRYREFMQFDIDIVGTRNLLADAEILATMVTTLDQLGIEAFEVRYSSRKILNGLIAWAQIPDSQGPDVMRVLDKFEKQGQEAVVAELGGGRIDDSGAKIDGLSLAPKQIELIDSFLAEALSGGSSRSLDWVKENLSDQEEAVEGIEDLQTIGSYLEMLGVKSGRAAVDLTIVRGLGYYTGAVFETTLTELPEYGSIFSGGRYDNLVNRFKGEPMPGVGASMGPDRLLAALIELKKVTSERSTSQVLVTVMDSEQLPYYLELLRSLRENGIRSEIYTGDTKNLTKQIRYGDRCGIPIALIAGSDEIEKNEVTVKNLRAGADLAKGTSDREEWLKAEGFQELIPKEKLIETMRNILG